MKYKIVSKSGKGNFSLCDEKKKELCKVTYDNMFSSKARTIINKDQFEIKARNIWWRKFDMFKNGIDIGDIVFNWRGHIIIRILGNDNKEHHFLMKRKGFWKSRFELENENEQKVLTMYAGYNWSKWRYNFDIQVHQQLPSVILSEELLVYCAYAANLYLSQMSAVAAGGSAAAC